jgi:hypothetical protein
VRISITNCQEGIYGVKHSAEGWFTTCPSDREDLGVLLSPDLSDADRATRIQTVLRDIEQSAPADDSFEVMCATHGLEPVAV